MQNEKKEINKTGNESFHIELEEAKLSDYYNFNLQNLAQKIKMQTYRPKSKMFYL
jgi:hypothetical protein